MPRTEMTDRVARAIEESMFAPHELPITDPWLHERYLETARVAIAAMREPTPEMIEAGHGEHMAFDHARGIWELMIDAANAEKDQPK